MPTLIFPMSAYAASIFGPQRVDIQAGPLEVVIHLHCHPQGSPFEGAPALMVWVRPESEDQEYKGSIFEAGRPLTKGEWIVAIEHAPDLLEVRRVARLIDDPAVENPRKHPDFRMLCASIGLDPDWRPGEEVVS